MESLTNESSSEQGKEDASNTVAESLSITDALQGLDGGQSAAGDKRRRGARAAELQGGVQSRHWRPGDGHAA